MLVTGFDIIFFWVARMMMMGLHFMGDVPFRTVYIHALVRDERGQKMSKSKGNVIDPLDLIDEYGSDALRFTLASQAAQGRDIKFSENARRGQPQLRHQAVERHALLPDERLRHRSEVRSQRLHAAGQPLDRRPRRRTRRVQVDAALAGYRFNDAASALYHFTWGEFCDWYIEFTKPILEGDDEAAKAETRATTAWVLGQLLHLLHPFMPFVTEELFEQVGGGGEPLITAPWPSHDGVHGGRARGRRDGLGDPADLGDPRRALRDERAAGGAAHHARARCRRPRRRAAPRHSSGADPPPGAPGSRSAIDGAAAPKGAVQIVIDEATIMLPLADVIDVGKEHARLTKDIAKLASEAGKIESKLGNEQFVAKAPPEVIEEQRERLAEARQALQKLTAARDRLLSA